MPQVFLSHNKKDKTIVKRVGDHLNRCLIKVWLDESEMRGGSNISNEIAKGIHGSNYFIPFISNHYLQSNWCLEELDRVSPYSLEKKITILPVLLFQRSKLDFSGLPEDRKILIENLLKRTKYLEIDKYNINPGIESIADSLGKNEAIRFDPIEEKTIDNVTIQVIRFHIQNGELPTTFLKTWDFNIEEFLADDEKNRDNRPILFNKSVGFYGKGPNWLFTAMAVPLKNLRTVFVYNTRTSDYICAYSMDKNLIGEVLKEV
jgi:hypothetical protein